MGDETVVTTVDTHHAGDASSLGRPVEPADPAARAGAGQQALPAAVEPLNEASVRRRQRIVDVALELLRAGDYHTIQMREVAERAGVSLGTVYRYFASKEHLFGAVDLEWVRQLEAAMPEDLPQAASNRERMGEALELVVAALENTPQLFRVVVMMEETSDVGARECYTRLSELTTTLVGRALRDLDPATRRNILHIMLAVLNQQLRWWSLGRLGIAEVRANLRGAVEVIFDYHELPGLVN